MNATKATVLAAFAFVLATSLVLQVYSFVNRNLPTPIPDEQRLVCESDISLDSFYRSRTELRRLLGNDNPWCRALAADKLMKLHDCWPEGKLHADVP